MANKENYNIISVSRHEKVSLMRHFLRDTTPMLPYYGGSISRKVTSLNLLVHDV